MVRTHQFGEFTPAPRCPRRHRSGEERRAASDRNMGQEDCGGAGLASCLIGIMQRSAFGGGGGGGLLPPTSCLSPLLQLALQRGVDGVVNVISWAE